MTRSFIPKQPAFLLAGAALTLLVLVTLAPGIAEAGCSHSVTSRADSERLSSLIAPLLDDVAGHSEDLPVPPSPRPCSGALCSGLPAVPAVPAGVIDVQAESWAWNAPVLGLASIGTSFLSTEPSDLQPKHRAITVFHPPRLLPSA
jgi:hypothetical protein